MNSSIRIRLAHVLLGLACAGCTALPVRRGEAPSTRGLVFDDSLYPVPAEIESGDLDVWIDDRAVVVGPGDREVLRVRFSFVSYRGYVGENEVHRSTGAVFFPVDASAQARPDRIGRVLVTEFPPGSSVAGFPFWTEYGERPAAELGTTSAIVDVRGPIARSLREYRNPGDVENRPFRSEAQLAYHMLREYQRTRDVLLLYEHHVAIAWIRTLRAVDEIVARETGVSDNAFLVAAESYGAVGAVQAAVVDDSVVGLVTTALPLDWKDFHFTRWRRWELHAGYDPLASLQPIPYADSQELFSFLSSSRYDPDPGCPSCVVGGDEWLAQFNVRDLRRSGHLREDVGLFLVVGDSDPESPIDLEIRWSVHADQLLPEGVVVRGGGPFATGRRPFPFDDIRYLRESPSTLSHLGAASAVLGWVDHTFGSRTLPEVSIVERYERGETVLDILVRRGNTVISGVDVYLTEIDARHDSDFLWRTHQSAAEPVEWRRVDVFYVGPDRFDDRWRASYPVDLGRNRAYYVVVRDRVGDREVAHSLPIRPFWNLEDPAQNRLRR